MVSGRQAAGSCSFVIIGKENEEEKLGDIARKPNLLLETGDLAPAYYFARHLTWEDPGKRESGWA